MHTVATSSVHGGTGVNVIIYFESSAAFSGLQSGTTGIKNGIRDISIVSTPQIVLTACIIYFSGRRHALINIDLAAFCVPLKRIVLTIGLQSRI